jgi:protein-arginine kinase
VAINQDKSVLVWVNKEDHIEFKSYACKNNAIESVLQKA